MKGDWRWWAGHLIGFGEVAFEAQLDERLLDAPDCPVTIEFRRMTRFIVTPRGTLGLTPWAPQGEKAIHETGRLRVSAIALLVEPTEALVTKLKALWSGLTIAQNVPPDGKGIKGIVTP